ncbi:MAG: phytanoyl-CoA dioxygenase family protein, partial [Chloroflexi bacterium]|nr:phytanoyl-CoA dioxygenase family protein [Chloroflexota bacterium]MCL5274704.1 phytanoyl-CoA dioxygenase family protein [Chloroflexota bacterium]
LEHRAKRLGILFHNRRQGHDRQFQFHPVIIAQSAKGEITTIEDYVHIQATPETYTAWTPLSDCPQALGGLAVLAGSHKLGLLPVHRANGAGGLGIDTDDIDLPWHTVDYQAGDVLIFHSFVVHKALPNRTADQVRLSTDYRYQGVSRPIVADGLEPHYGRLGWPEIYKGWRRADLQYYWRDLSLKTVARDPSFHANAADKQ